MSNRTWPFATPLLKDSPVPLYKQLAQGLGSLIDRNTINPGRRLPNEDELCRIYGISRVTVRKALAELADAGLIDRRQGKGTFVRPPLVERELASLRGLHDIIASQGFRAKVEVLSLGFDSRADPKVAQLLKVRPGDPVIRLQRRHLLDGAPVALTVVYLPAWCRPLVTAQAVRRMSLYRMLEAHGRIRVAVANQRISAVKATAGVATSLGVHRGDPLLLVDSVGVAEDGRPVDYSRLLYNPAKLALSVTLKRSGIEAAMVLER
mgnify:CR=1 FL=1